MSVHEKIITTVTPRRWTNTLLTVLIFIAPAIRLLPEPAKNWITTMIARHGFRKRVAFKYEILSESEDKQREDR